MVKGIRLVGLPNRFSQEVYKAIGNQKDGIEILRYVFVSKIGKLPDRRQDREVMG